MMKPKIFEFHDERDLIQEVKMLAARGVKKENLYVMSIKSDQAKRVAQQVHISTVGLKAEGLDTFAKNAFKKKKNRLRAKFEEFGFDSTEAEALKDELEAGKILLIQKVT